MIPKINTATAAAEWIKALTLVLSWSMPIKKNTLSSCSMGIRDISCMNSIISWHVDRNIDIKQIRSTKNSLFSFLNAKQKRMSKTNSWNIKPIQEMFTTAKNSIQITSRTDRLVDPRTSDFSWRTSCLFMYSSPIFSLDT